MRISKRDASREALFLLALLSGALVASAPFFSSHAVMGFDIYFHLARIEGIKEGLLSGQFPVRLHAFQFHGYGYPAGIFYPDLFLYFPALLRLFGVPLVLSYNIYGVCVNIATVFVSFFSFSALLKSRKAGFAAALFYTGFFYRLTSLYSRSAIGEVTAMAFLPLALVSLWLLLHRACGWWPLFVLSVTGVMSSHILTSILVFFACIIICLASLSALRQREVRVALFKALVFILMINLWFIVPFVSFYTAIPFHLKNSLASDLETTAGSLGALMPLQFFTGWTLLIIIALAAVRFIFDADRRQSHDTDGRKIFFVSLVTGVVSVFTYTRFFPWRWLLSLPGLGLLRAMQSPVRLAMFAAFFLSIAGAVALLRLLKNTRFSKPCLLLAALFPLVTNFLALRDLHTTSVNDATRLDIDWSIRHEDFADDILSHQELPYLDYLYSDITFPTTSAALAALPPDDVRPRSLVKRFTRTGNTLRFTIRAKKSARIVLPLFYYPGYEARTAGGATLHVTWVKQHRLAVDVPAGENEITIRYVGEPAFWVSDKVSLASLVLFVMVAWRESRKSRLFPIASPM